MVILWGTWMSLLGCTGGPNPETLVSELRILALVLEPPEAMPGETVLVTAHVADPNAGGAEMAGWTCGGFGGECLEQDPGRIRVAEGQPPLFTMELTAPFEATGILATEEELAVSVWGLACEVGACPLIGEPEPTPEALGDPVASLGDLPMEGVALARRSLWVSMREPEVRRKNLEFELQSELPEEVDASKTDAQQEVSLKFSVGTEGAVAYGVTTAGGFTVTEAETIDGVIELVWVAPEKAGKVRMWVVFEDDSTGGAVWSNTILVQ
ncbi:MAG: hypothetical protein VX519_05035 [Myxococcota bacterium]|nr:hypothetical protein [Myxococcota bacterium]